MRLKCIHDTKIKKYIKKKTMGKQTRIYAFWKMFNQIWYEWNKAIKKSKHILACEKYNINDQR